MKNRPPKNVENVIPFITIGFFIALFVGLLFVFSYVLIWGLFIGFILWIIAIIKQHLFSKKPNKEGRIIEHDDKK